MEPIVQHLEKSSDTLRSSYAQPRWGCMKTTYVMHFEIYEVIWRIRNSAMKAIYTVILKRVVLTWEDGAMIPLKRTLL